MIILYYPCLFDVHFIFVLVENDTIHVCFIFMLVENNNSNRLGVSEVLLVVSSSLLLGGCGRFLCFFGTGA